MRRSGRAIGEQGKEKERAKEARKRKGRRVEGAGNALETGRVPRRATGPGRDDESGQPWPAVA